MTFSALAEPPPSGTAGRAGASGGAPDAGPGDSRPGDSRPGDSGPGELEDYARRLMTRLHALGLRASGPWDGPGQRAPHESAPSLMAVSAQCVQVEPYVGRTVWLLAPPGGEPARDGDLYWHWQRPRRDRDGRPVARWFQPFCPAADPERAATAISEAIFADVRRRDRGPAGLAVR
ncbi:hypothetical protein [Actinomadura verrucosospora]|uniref:LPXTG-motif cell wall anchor domain-containing protein n=1 Tax=Actinomadura verrucosospora TaxID=46165 RepID=A0A7D3ZMZ9_ACTVE|nr:hypothetical protein [Actinomadura verrucosospora]QKG24381.1 LPXTG-motif cell wall anchor domain-containing protein [Actinomadura verrucosospora]